MDVSADQTIMNAAFRIISFIPIQTVTDDDALGDPYH